jgi:hypothetical protein
MNDGVVRRVTAWSFAASGAGAVLWAAVAPAVTVPGIDPPRLSTPSHAASRHYPADSLARLAISRDVFRLARRAAAIAYDPQRAAAPTETYQAPKPALALVGLVAGAEATAVIEGFPGVEGARVVRVGDVVSGLRVKQIVSDRVVIGGMDTTWVLRVREPWR